MIFRASEKAILFFDKNSGDTGIISGFDYENILRWLKTNQLNSTIVYLMSRYNLSDYDKDKLLKAFQNTYPPIPRSFAVPESLHIELTTRCSLNCPQCYKDQQIEHDILFERLEEIISEAAQIGVFQIAFGGGEPLLYPHLIAAIKKVSEHGMGASITSGGINLSENLAKLIAAGIDHIQISLNGTTEEINAKTRDGYQAAIDALKLLQKSDCSFGINIVLSKTNISDLEKMILFAQTINAKNLNLLRYKPSNKYGMENIELDEGDYKLIKNLIKKYNGPKMAIKVDSAFGNLLAYLYRENLDANYSGCTAGRRFMAIDAEGKFKACSHLEQAELNKSVLDFWQKSALLEGIRKTEQRIKEPCATCRYLNNCRGCRAICNNKYNDFYAGEHDCFVFLGGLNDKNI